MKRLRNLSGDERGNVAITFAVLMAATVPAVGAAIDYSFAAFQRTKLQRAADAAALAGARLLPADVSGAKQRAKDVFDANAWSEVSAATAATTDTVTAEASFLVETYLMRILGRTHLSVSVRAVAARGMPKPPCVLTLDKTEKEALFINSASKLNTDCGVQVNSTAPSEALRLNSGSSINSEEICVAGGWTPGGSNMYKPTPQKCPAFADPLVNLPAPAEATAGCTVSNHKIDGGTETLSPGVYCNTLTIDNGAVVTLTSGVYVIRDGQLKLNSGATLKGDGVLLFFTGTDARLQMDSSSKLEVSAPVTGTFADVVIFQDRKTTTDFFMINSHGSSKIHGAIYVPNSTLKLNSNSGSAATSDFFQIIVHRLELNSLATIVINNKKYEAKQSALRERSVRLIQ